jgi:hypothetical protein
MELKLAVACDEARERPDGKLDIIGVVNHLHAEGFPAMQEGLVVVFVVEWSAAEAGRQPLRADLVDEAERTVLTIQGHTDVPTRPATAPPVQTRLILPIDVVFPKEGRYHFHLRAGGARQERAITLHVAAHAPASPDPAAGDRV